MLFNDQVFFGMSDFFTFFFCHIFFLNPTQTLEKYSIQANGFIGNSHLQMLTNENKQFCTEYLVLLPSSLQC
jgi:hypothetical protein